MKRKETPPKKRRITHQSAKARGRTLQKWVAEKISELTGIPCGKDEEIESRPMGQSGVDIRLSANARQLFPFSVECKNQETWALPAWIAQAAKNCLPETQWLLVCKKNHGPRVVVLDATAFFNLLKGLKND